MQKKLLYLFTRTPLHVGAGASVGAIDQPIIRERHTGFPVIPATSLKGAFADQWPLSLRNAKGDLVRLTTKKQGEKHVIDQTDPSDAAWLFGSDDANVSFAGALLFSEARLLAFPVRSAKGSFAWISCPLILRRAKRDGVLTDLSNLPDPSDEQALFPAESPLALGDKVVLEEYTFTRANGFPQNLGSKLAALLPEDPVWAEVASRLVILSDGMMSFFAQNACEVAQHVRIDDDTGTAAGGALFNQENVPSETLFYAVLHATDGRGASYKSKTAKEALDAFAAKLNGAPFQFGGDASTGLGWCTVKLA
ncbi:MAG: type III-B CRISPR module RAMP protein Cmr4 [Verrucomicrobia bacterium]|nr:type III-B CRISPR module RAMP protein Cmr4 [Verrucomicrobiota bacterium]